MPTSSRVPLRVLEGVVSDDHTRLLLQTFLVSAQTGISHTRGATHTCEGGGYTGGTGCRGLIRFQAWLGKFKYKARRQHLHGRAPCVWFCAQKRRCACLSVFIIATKVHVSRGYNPKIHTQQTMLIDSFVHAARPKRPGHIIISTAQWFIGKYLPPTSGSQLVNTSNETFRHQHKRL